MAVASNLMKQFDTAAARFASQRPSVRVKKSALLQTFDMSGAQDDLSLQHQEIRHG